MKKALLLFFIMGMTLYANSNSVQKGQTYYKYILKPMLGYDGAVFTKKYTKQQWDRLFSHNATEFKKVFKKDSKDSKTFKAFVKSEKFKNISNDLKAFAIFYAKDASVTPSCQE